MLYAGRLKYLHGPETSDPRCIVDRMASHVLGRIETVQIWRSTGMVKAPHIWWGKNPDGKACIMHGDPSQWKVRALHPAFTGCTRLLSAITGASWEGSACTESGIKRRPER